MTLDLWINKKTWLVWKMKVESLRSSVLGLDWQKLTRKLTCPLKINGWKMYSLLKYSLYRGHSHSNCATRVSTCTKSKLLEIAVTRNQTFATGDVFRLYIDTFSEKTSLSRLKLWHELFPKRPRMLRYLGISMLEKWRSICNVKILLASECYFIIFLIAMFFSFLSLKDKLFTLN